MCVHALHAVHALPELRVVGGRLGGRCCLMAPCPCSRLNVAIHANSLKSLGLIFAFSNVTTFEITQSIFRSNGCQFLFTTKDSVNLTW
jgi:hypothetical protein